MKVLGKKREVYWNLYCTFLRVHLRLATGRIQIFLIVPTLRSSKLALMTSRFLKRIKQNCNKFCTFVILLHYKQLKESLSPSQAVNF